jgi:hypothetical protein
LERFVRYWRRRDQEIQLEDDGFLVDPTSFWRQYSTPLPHTLEELGDVPCLVLLGEQGMGKTMVLEGASEKLRSLPGNMVIYKDLAHVPSEYSLMSSVLPADNYQDWAASSDVLTVLIDTLDQCYLSPIETLDLIVQELRSKRLDQAIQKRLHLRITCRTVDWPTSEEEELNDLWGPENVQVLELCPLRRRDAEASAKERHLNPDEFMSWIDQKKLAPMAAGPITLSFLTDTFRTHPDIKHVSQVDLYDEGMKRLGRETNKQRRENLRSPPVPLVNRLSVAKRLAVTSVLGDIKSFASPSADTVSDSHVLGFQEALEMLQRGVNRDQYTLNELLVATYDCALFSGAGSERLFWAHSTYGEFLAAQYLKDNEVPPKDIEALLSQDNLQTPIVRQLAPLASWLCAMLRSIYEWIRDKSPELLLSITPVFEESDNDKELFVDALLQRYSQPDKPYAPRSLARTAVRFDHPKIGQQLARYLAKRKLHSASRELALLYARELALPELVPFCLKIALDGEEPDAFREFAVDEVARSANDEQRKTLRSLVLDRTDRPKSMDVLGAALEALWKSDLTPTELFASLVPPQDGMLFPTYMRFLNTTLPSSLSVTNLPSALEWVASLDESWLGCRDAYRLIDAITRASWKLADSYVDAFPAEAFAKACWHLISERRSVLLAPQGRENRGFFTAGDQAVRHNVVMEILSLPDCRADSAWDFVRTSTPMLDSDDFEWIIETLSRTTDVRQRETLIALIRVLYSQDVEAHVSLLLDECEKEPDLRARFQESLQPVLLGSPEAQQMKTEHDQWKEAEDETAKDEAERASEEKRRPTVATIQEVITEQFLNNTGDAARPWLFVYEALSQTVGDAEWTSSISPLDIKSMAAWKLLDEKTQADVLACARDFLACVDPLTEEWAGTNEWMRVASDGVPALVLLVRCADDSPATVSNQLVARWLPAMMAVPGFWPEDDKLVLGTVLSGLAVRAPDIATETAQRMLLRLRAARDTSLGELGRLDFVWNESIAQLVIETVSSDDIGDKILYWCLTALANHGVQGVKESALKFVNCDAIDGGEENARNRALSAATVLMQSCHDWWSMLWPVVSDYPSFGRSFVLSVARACIDGAATPIDCLTDEEAGTFYNWLSEQFPEAESTPRIGAHFLTQVDDVYELRHRLLERLRRGESQNAVDALGKIRDRFPADIMLSQYVSESASNLASRIWSPLPVDDLCNLLDRPGARYVATQDQLLEVVSEQIKDMQRRLHGETPMWRFLWNDIKEGRRDVWQPKEELDISDWVKDCLTLSLAGTRIVVNREVQITRGAGNSAPGELADIKVDATSHDEPPNPLEVIVETKGCWNPGLRKDMEKQLAHRYLNTGDSRHGVYLVGWFNWQEWADGESQHHRRARACRNGSKAELEEMLSAQANNLKRQGFSIVPIVLDFTPPMSLPMEPTRKVSQRSSKSR